MKFFLLAPFLFVYFMNAECLTGLEEMMEAHKGCMATSGATEEMAQRAKAGDFPEDMVFKKHALCMSVKLGFMDEAGNIKMDFVKQNINKHIPDAGLAAEILSKCTEVKETPEETAFADAKCFYTYKDKWN